METCKIITKLKELDDGVPNIISKWILLNFLMAQPKSCCLLSVDSKQIDIHRKLESCYVAAQFANISGILKLKGWGRGHDMQIILQINYKTQINQVDFKIDYFHLIDFPMLISIASLYFLRHVRRNYRSSFLLCKSEQIAQNQIQSNVDIMLRDVCVIEYAHSLSRMGFVSRNNTAHQFRFTTRMEQLPSIILNAFFHFNSVKTSARVPVLARPSFRCCRTVFQNNPLLVYLDTHIFHDVCSVVEYGRLWAMVRFLIQNI